VRVLTNALLRKFCIWQASYLLGQAKGASPHASLVVSRTTIPREPKASRRTPPATSCGATATRACKDLVQTSLLGVEFVWELDLERLCVDSMTAHSRPLAHVVSKPGSLSRSRTQRPSQMSRGRTGLLHAVYTSLDWASDSRAPSREYFLGLFTLGRCRGRRSARPKDPDRQHDP